MDSSQGAFRIGTVLCVAAALFMATVISAGPAAAASSTSDADCEALLNGQLQSSSSGGGSNDLAYLKTTAASFVATAKDVSDKKLKKALQSIASIYSEASKGKSVAGASAVLAKRSKAYSKSYGVFTKALTACQLASVGATNK